MSSENKGADQLRGYREADLRLCFRICKKPVFSWRGSIGMSKFNQDISVQIKRYKKSGSFFIACLFKGCFLHFFRFLEIRTHVLIEIGVPCHTNECNRYPRFYTSMIGNKITFNSYGCFSCSISFC